jgi:hypothetical protein
MSRFDSLQHFRGRLLTALGAVIAATVVAMAATTASPTAPAPTDAAESFLATSGAARQSQLGFAAASNLDRGESSLSGRRGSSGWFLYRPRLLGRADLDRSQGGAAVQPGCPRQLRPAHSKGSGDLPPKSK